MTPHPHDEAESQRAKHTSDILGSKSEKIVVVAGPGTGKTFLFSKILEGKTGGSTLTLSFINALVDDLSLGLCGLSEVKTLHGFSMATLNGTGKTKIKIFPKLCEVIKKDAEMLLGKKVDFEKMFQTGEVDEGLIAFYKKRKDSYGSFYGFSDAVYAVVKYMEAYPDKIPAFAQIVVDEFQDFNKIEVNLIELLASKSPIVIAGDDDQSLYVDLKSASPEFIREIHGPKRPEYESFNLPFCSRSTQVIVEAINDVTSKAKENGLLEGRVEKPYQYFTCKDKDKESTANPKIVHTQVFEKAVPQFIQSEMCEIAKTERKKVSVLVIIPPQLKSRLLPYYSKKLKEKGFKNIASVDVSSNKGLTLMDALHLLLDDNKCELAWRIVAQTLLDEKDFKTLLEETNTGKKVSELLSKDIKKQVNEHVQCLKKIRDEKECDTEKLDELFKAIGIDPLQIASEKIREEIQSKDWNGTSRREIKEMDIAVTTIPSSKGLAADYVFITHFDQPYFSQKGKVTDGDVYNFLVALTRARKKAYLISTQEKNRPTILDWIDKDRIQ